MSNYALSLKDQLDVANARVARLEAQTRLDALAIQAQGEYLNRMAARLSEPIFAFRRKGQDSFCTCDKARFVELLSKPDTFEVRTFYAIPVPPEDPEAVQALRRIEEVLRKHLDVQRGNSAVHFAYYQAFNALNTTPEKG